jgi:hypothetical protein
MVCNRKGYITSQPSLGNSLNVGHFNTLRFEGLGNIFNLLRGACNSPFLRHGGFIQVVETHCNPPNHLLDAHTSPVDKGLFDEVAALFERVDDCAIYLVAIYLLSALCPRLHLSTTTSMTRFQAPTPPRGEDFPSGRIVNKIFNGWKNCGLVTYQSAGYGGIQLEGVTVPQV